MRKIIILLGIAVVAAMLAGCMNPLDFNPDDFALNMNANVTGELSVDQINSSEIQIRNHTKSIDIFDIKFVELAETDSDLAAGTLGAQISGAPTAGTQESIFLRPWKKYRIELKWREAKPQDASPAPGPYTETTYPSWDWGKSYVAGLNNVNAYRVIENLPRGKYVLHVYRTLAGEIKISIDEDWAEVVEGDHHGGDFNLEVKSQIFVDLSGMTFNLNLPRDPINVNVDFSAEVKNQLSVEFDKISKSIDDLRSFPVGYGLVIVKNKTSKTASEIQFKKPSGNIVTAGQAAAQDESVGVLMAAGAPEYTIKLQDNSGTVVQTIGPKTVNVVNQKIVYIHLYEVNGKIEADINDNPTYKYELLVKTTSEYDKYGSLTVYNMTGKKLDNVVFYNTQGQKYFSVDNITKQGSKGPALNGDQNIYVLVGNYQVGVIFEGYSMDIFDRKIESLLYHGSTKLFIYEGAELPANAPPGESVLISRNLQSVDYYLNANGVAPTGPGTGTTTTEVYIEFEDPVSISQGDITQVSSATDAVIKSLSGSGKNWKLTVDVKASHEFVIKIDKPGIAAYDHKTLVYKEEDLPPVNPDPDPIVGEITMFMFSFPLNMWSASSETNPNEWTGISVGSTLAPSGIFNGPGSISERQEAANHAVHEVGSSIYMSDQSNGSKQYKVLAKDANAWIKIKIPAAYNNGNEVVCHIVVK